MAHIYITGSGSTVGVNGGRLEIHQKDGLLKSVPRETVESIAIFGNSSLTPSCIQFVLEKGISVSYFSGKGKYFGRLESTSHHRTDVMKKQFEVCDNEGFCLDMGRKMISAKIRNQEVVLRRYVKEPDDNQLQELNIMKKYHKKAENAESIEELLGYEGIAARTYFKCIGGFIEREFAFNGRSKRPPEDAFNSMLSLGYTLLMYEIYSKIEDEGMSPFYAAVHKNYGNHPALASDLMEEWRSVIVDSVVLSLIQGHEIHIDEFYKDEENGGVFLEKSGMRKFISKFERKMNSTSKYLIYDDANRSIRNSLVEQCKRMRACLLLQNSKEYMPVIIR